MSNIMEVFDAWWWTTTKLSTMFRANLPLMSNFKTSVFLAGPSFCNWYRAISAPGPGPLPDFDWWRSTMMYNWLYMFPMQTSLSNRLSLGGFGMIGRSTSNLASFSIVPLLKWNGWMTFPRTPAERSRTALSGSQVYQLTVTLYAFKDFRVLFSGITWKNSTPWSVMNTISLIFVQLKPRMVVLFPLQVWEYSMVSTPSPKLTNSTDLCERWIASIFMSYENLIEITSPLSSILKLMDVFSSGPLTTTPAAPPDLTVNTWRFESSKNTFVSLLTGSNLIGFFDSST